MNDWLALLMRLANAPRLIPQLHNHWPLRTRVRPRGIIRQIELHIDSAPSSFDMRTSGINTQRPENEREEVILGESHHQPAKTTQQCVAVHLEAKFHAIAGQCERILDKIVVE